MHKNKIHVLIYVSIVVPVLLCAGALERYSIPQQQSAQINSAQRSESVSEDVYFKFKNKIRDYSAPQKEKLKKYYRTKMKEAVREKNFDAALYYERLIDILDSNS